MGALANAMTSMAMTIKQHESELEEQVASRTRELTRNQSDLTTRVERATGCAVIAANHCEECFGTTGRKLLTIPCLVFYLIRWTLTSLLFVVYPKIRQFIHTLSATLNTKN